MSARPRRGVDTNFGEAGYCTHCHRDMPAGVDACLGVLPGVSHACCGHGNPAWAYVVFGGLPDQDLEEVEGWTELRGQAAVDYFAAVSPEEQENG